MKTTNLKKNESHNRAIINPIHLVIRMYRLTAMNHLIRLFIIRMDLVCHK